MRTIALTLASAGLLALTACGGGEANNSSANTLGNDPLAVPADNFTDFGTNSLGTDTGNATLGADTNLSANTSAGDTSTNTTNSLGNSQ